MEAVEKHYDIALVKIPRPGCALQNCVIQYLPLFIHATKIAKVVKSCNFINKNSPCLIPVIFQRRFQPLYSTTNPLTLLQEGESLNMSIVPVEPAFPL